MPNVSTCTSARSIRFHIIYGQSQILHADNWPASLFWSTRRAQSLRHEISSGACRINELVLCYKMWVYSLIYSISTSCHVLAQGFNVFGLHVACQNMSTPSMLSNHVRYVANWSLIVEDLVHISLSCCHGAWPWIATPCNLQARVSSFDPDPLHRQ